MSEMIHLENLSVEALAEMANEAAAASLSQWEECKATGSKAVEHAARCGRALQAIKAQLPHGKWASWVEESFPFGIRRSQQFMEIAKAHARALLTNASSFQDALRLMEEAPEKQAKRQEREAKKQERQPEKTEAPPNPPAVPAPPAKLERPAWLADPDELDRPEEDELQPLPRTNTHHTAANRRTPDARETDRVGIVPPDDPRSYHDGHWYEWSEDRGRMVAVTDEEILRRADEIRGQAIVEPASTTTPVVEHKTASLSHKPGKAPTVQQLTTAVGDRVHDGDWQDLWRGKLERAVESWARYKQSLTGKAKVRSMESWEAALSRIENVAHDRGVDAVCDMIEKAIANGWQGWEHETNDRKARGMAGGRIYSQLEKAQVKYDPLPE